MAPVTDVGGAFPRKTLGVGVNTDEQAWLVPEAVCREGYTLTTPVGDVRLEGNEAGVRVASAPDGVRTARICSYS